jgi:hypothetical protein
MTTPSYEFVCDEIRMMDRTNKCLSSESLYAMTCMQLSPRIIPI